MCSIVSIIRRVLYRRFHCIKLLSLCCIFGEYCFFSVSFVYPEIKEETKEEDKETCYS